MGQIQGLLIDDVAAKRIQLIQEFHAKPGFSPDYVSPFPASNSLTGEHGTFSKAGSYE
jgi:hypothetical protein